MKKKNFKAEMILNKKFSTELTGYNPLEVDTFFDLVIEDYNEFESYIANLEDKLEDKTQIIQEKDSEISKLQVEIQNYKNQLEQSSKANMYEMMKEIKNLKDEIKKNK